MITFILGFVLGAVAGALFARRNLKKVEAAVVKANEVKSQVESKIQR